ncbi:MAG: GerMN domain-containing protein [Actinomycetales bacterium]
MPAPSARPFRGRTAGTLAGAVVGLLTLAGCTASATAGTTSTMPVSSGQSTSTVSSAPLESAQNTSKLPVYWLGRSNQDIFLYREFLASSSTGDPIRSALETMTSQKPLDPDFFTPWKKPSKLGASISAKNVITVDISADAFSRDVDQGIAERAIQQLVYTATAAAANAGLIDSGQGVQVSILVDGHTDYLAFGKIKLDKPISRGGTFLAPVWIIDPQQDSAATGTIPVHGTAASADGSDGTVRWQLLKTNGTAIPSSYLDGSAPTSGPSGPTGTYDYPLSAPPGTYELRVWERRGTDPAAQYGLDTKDFTVK